MKICIETQEDGTFLVGEDVEAPGMGEAMPGEAAQDLAQGMQPAATVEEALQMAGAMLQGPQPTEEDAAMAGYNKGQRQMPKSMGPGKVFGE
jgi:hypothetical protein